MHESCLQWYTFGLYRQHNITKKISDEKVASLLFIHLMLMFTPLLNRKGESIRLPSLFSFLSCACYRWGCIMKNDNRRGWTLSLYSVFCPAFCIIPSLDSQSRDRRKLKEMLVHYSTIMMTRCTHYISLSHSLASILCTVRLYKWTSN